MAIDFQSWKTKRNKVNTRYFKLFKGGILEQNADALDSAVCLLAAKDFIEGDVYFPENISLAKKEGWIWVKRI